MLDVTHHTVTLRTARGKALLLCSPATLALVKENKVPKGNVLEMARCSGMLAAKCTAQMIPYCHPVGLDALEIHFEFMDGTQSPVMDGDQAGRSGILIQAEAKLIGRSGIELEVLTAVSVAALTAYDLLKPLDSRLEITGIQILEKKTGLAEGSPYFKLPPTCAILVCSDSTAAGERKDNSGKILRELLEKANAQIVDYKICPDQKEIIQSSIMNWVSRDVQFIFTTGGTGLGPRDLTVSSVREILERDADGIAEAMRVHGQMRTPLAMMSRGVAGSIAQTLVVTLPGSSDGVRQSLEAILPAVFHARKMMKGGGH
ncbi:MAG: bifunctional molybdenum cofactor biosynthesis protein MoaC/MoaB [Chitinophagaceae bacterium]